jgi:uncharacterized protein YndB with AHSA1/START domain
VTQRRENRIEVPGTPEQVWEMIATGHGIEAWFVPAEVEPRVGGRVALDIMGTGIEDAGNVTGWEPPYRFSYEEEWNQPAGRLATEFLIEARSGGTCVVRLVSTLHAEEGDWDSILDSLHAGWEGYLLILRLHLEHFAGRRCRTVMAAGQGDFAELTAGLGLEGAKPGDEVESTGGPRLAGIVEHRGEQELIVRIEAPAPGVALLFAYGPMALAHLYLFGEADDGTAEEWRDWMAVPSAG